MKQFDSSVEESSKVSEQQLRNDEQQCPSCKVIVTKYYAPLLVIFISCSLHSTEWAKIVHSQSNSRALVINGTTDNFKFCVK